MSSTKSLTIVILHCVFGVLLARYPGFAYYWGVAILLCGIADIIASSNKENQAAFWAAYFMGSEVLLRMTDGALSWESGKYGVSALLVVGLLVDPRSSRQFPNKFIVYFLLLLPSIVATEYLDFESARQGVSFNLSGPLTLMISALYFYHRSVSRYEIKQALLASILPLISMVAYLTLVTPNFDQIEFSSQSNFVTSGGFGPNQVATALGLGILIIGISLYMRLSVSGYTIVDFLIFSALLFRGLLTFSRGGVLSAGLCLSLMVFLSVFFTKSAHRNVSYYLSFTLIIFFIALSIWNYVNDITNESLSYRYRGINVKTNEQQDLTSHRLLIFREEMNLFYSNPLLGVGPGMSKYYFEKKYGVGAASHSEFSRLLAEHGLLGILAMLIVVYSLVKHVLQINRSQLSFFVPLIMYAILTTFHSAMRLAIAPFLLGMVLSILSQRKIPEHGDSLRRK